MELSFPTIKSRVLEIWRHTGFQKYFRNTGWMMSGRIFSLLVNFFVSAYIARYFGPENYGLFSYAISFASIFLFFSGFGIDSIVLRELVIHEKEKHKILGTGFIIKFLSSILAIVFTTIVAFMINDVFYTNVLIISFSFFTVFQSFNIISTYFQSKVLSRKNVRIEFIVIILSTFLKLLFIYLQLGILPFILIYVFEHVIFAIGFVITYIRESNSIFAWEFSKKLAKSLIKSSWPLVLVMASTSIYLRIDQVLIGFLMDTKSVGIYAVAVKLSEVWYFLPGIICASLFPSVIHSKKRGDEMHYKNRLKKLYSLLFYLSIIFIIFTLLVAKPVVLYLFGIEYIESLTPLRIYAWSNIGMFWSTAITQYLILEDYTKISFAIHFIGMMTNIILNIILIPKFGVSGAAYATLISYFIAVFSIVLFKKTRGQALILLQSIKVV